MNDNQCGHRPSRTASAGSSTRSITIGQLRAALARADRRRVRHRLRDRSACAAGSGPGRSASSATSCCSSSSSVPPSTRPTSATPLFGQAGRQVFFIVTSIYGWWRWSSSAAGRRGARRAGDHAALGHHARADRRSSRSGWSASSSSSRCSSPDRRPAGPLASRWYYWCDAWIFVGSMVATYAMARGWNEFWLAWIGVDIVGVPLLVRTPATYPTARAVHVLRRVRHLRLRRLGAATRTERPTGRRPPRRGSGTAVPPGGVHGRPPAPRHGGRGRRPAPRRPRTLEGREDVRRAVRRAGREGPRPAPPGRAPSRPSTPACTRSARRSSRRRPRSGWPPSTSAPERTAEEISQLLYHLQVLMLPAASPSTTSTPTCRKTRPCCASPSRTRDRSSEPAADMLREAGYAHPARRQGARRRRPRQRRRVLLPAPARHRRLRRLRHRRRGVTGRDLLLDSGSAARSR